MNEYYTNEKRLAFGSVLEFSAKQNHFIVYNLSFGIGTCIQVFISTIN